MPQRIIKHIEYYVEGRLFEWVMGLSMLGLAIEIWKHPAILENSSFQQLTEVLSPFFVGVFMAVVGGVRVIALLINGHWVVEHRTGPLLRAGAAVLCGWMWAQFAWALIDGSLERGYTFPSLPFWLMFSLGEIYVAYKAALNARRTL